MPISHLGVLVWLLRGGAGLEDEMTNRHGEPLTHETREPRLDPALGPLPASGDDDFIRREGGEGVLDGLEGVRL